MDWETQSIMKKVRDADAKDAQSRIAELEAEVARLTASQTIDGWDAARWKHEYDVQLYLAKSAWEAGRDAAANLQINGMDVISPVAKAYILALRP